MGKDLSMLKSWAASARFLHYRGNDSITWAPQKKTGCAFLETQELGNQVLSTRLQSVSIDYIISARHLSFLKLDIGCQVSQMKKPTETEMPKQ